MANNRTITSANAVIIISVAGLYDVGQRIQGFTADDISGTDSIEQAEFSMGVDGRLSAGYAPVAVPQTITLQSDSLSNDFFENWWAAEQQERGKFIATSTIILPALSRKYALTRGFLRGYMPIPSLKRTIQARSYSLMWERVTPAPF